MNSFRYFEPVSAHEAVALLAAEPHARLLAGGTTLIDLMKQRVELPEIVVDINRLPLNDLRWEGDRLWAGALVRNTALAIEPGVRERLPFLAQALLAGASGQLRNLATVGGNLLQRTRCAYFREATDLLPCNKRAPGTGCSALDGYNRGHAVLGGSTHCIATMPSDMAVPLIALDTVVAVLGPGGERRVPLAGFYLLPGETPQRETVLDPGEIILGIEIPASEAARRSHYVKVRDRASYAFALASAAVGIEVRDGRIAEARIAFGGIATVPWRSREAEAVLQDQVPGEALYREAATAALREAQPRTHNAFKIPLAAEVLVRALTAVETLP